MNTIATMEALTRYLHCGLGSAYHTPAGHFGRLGNSNPIFHYLDISSCHNYEYLSAPPISLKEV